MEQFRNLFNEIQNLDTTPDLLYEKITNNNAASKNYIENALIDTDKEYKLTAVDREKISQKYGMQTLKMLINISQPIDFSYNNIKLVTAAQSHALKPHMRGLAAILSCLPEDDLYNPSPQTYLARTSVLLEKSLSDIVNNKSFSPQDISFLVALSKQHSEAVKDFGGRQARNICGNSEDICTASLRDEWQLIQSMALAARSMGQDKPDFQRLNSALQVCFKVLSDDSAAISYKYSVMQKVWDLAKEFRIKHPSQPDRDLNSVLDLICERKKDVENLLPLMSLRDQPDITSDNKTLLNSIKKYDLLAASISAENFIPPDMPTLGSITTIVPGRENDLPPEKTGIVQSTVFIAGSSGGMIPVSVITQGIGNQCIHTLYVSPEDMHRLPDRAENFFHLAMNCIETGRSSFAGNPAAYTDLEVRLSPDLPQALVRATVLYDQSRGYESVVDLGAVVDNQKTMQRFLDLRGINKSSSSQSASMTEKREAKENSANKIKSNIFNSVSTFFSSLSSSSRSRPESTSTLSSRSASDGSERNKSLGAKS